MGLVITERFPLRPLLALAAAKWPENDGQIRTRLAREAGIDRDTIRAWADLGIPEIQADRIAVKVFNLPHCLIWPEALLDPDEIPDDIADHTPFHWPQTELFEAS